MARRVIIVEEECVGCQSCVELCPEVIAFDEAGEKAAVIRATGEPKGAIEEALATCSAQCIHGEGGTGR
jgi:ferredoxin